MKTIITIIILALLAWGGYALFSREGGEATPSATIEEIYTTPSTATSTSTSSPTVIPEVKQFTVVGSNFAFSPSTLTVNKGDKVRIVFQSQGTHDWVVDAFNARTKVLTTGQSETIEFIADKTGSFEYYCSVGSHRQMGMKGTLVVK